MLFNSLLSHAQDFTDSAYLEYKKSQNQFYQKRFDSTAKNLRLPLISESSDSFSLRLWEYTMFGRSLYTISGQNTIWEAHKYRFSAGDSNLRKEQINSKTTIIVIIDSLKFFNFQALPNQYEIANFQSTVYDGVTYILEIKTVDSYYCFAYENPKYYAKSELYNRQFYNVIKLLDKIFHLE